jgi:hypothetical protein
MGRYPETSFEIINTSITAVNSHVILPIAKETMHKINPDLVLFYMPHFLPTLPTAL